MDNRLSKPVSYALAALLAVSLGGCEMLSTSSTYEDAQRAFDKGQFRIANAHLSDILANGSADDNADGRVRKLQLELMLAYGDGNRAMAAIDQLPEGALSKEERRAAMAHAYLLQGAPAKVVQLYDPVRREEFTEQDMRMQLWAAREIDKETGSETGDNSAFEERLDASLSRFGQSAHLNALGADHFYDLGLRERADPYARAALQYGPEIFEARLVAGRRAIFEGELEQAIVHYTKANQINPLNPLPLTNVAGLHLDLGQTEKAGDVIKIALDNYGDYPFLQWQLARYKLATGDLQGARDAKDRVARIYSDNTEFMLLAAHIEAGLGNKSIALDSYRRFVREVGEVPEVMAKIAELEG